MPSIAQLDQEYRMYFEQIMGMLDQLSSISLEFVSSKLTFLEKYSQSLKDSQVDARQHRNNQIRNLIEYVKMHRKSKVRTVLHSPKTFHFSLKNNSMQDIEVQPNSCLNNSQKSFSDSKLVHTKTVKNLLKNMVTQKKGVTGGDPVFKLLEDAMRLLASQQQHYQNEYDKLSEEYESLLQENPHLQAKLSIEKKSSQIKENLNSLIETQKSFKSYLNSII